MSSRLAAVAAFCMLVVVSACGAQRASTHVAARAGAPVELDTEYSRAAAIARSSIEHVRQLDELQRARDAERQRQLALRQASDAQRAARKLAAPRAAPTPAPTLSAALSGSCSLPSTCPALRQCENGRYGYAFGDSPPYFGAYQFSSSTWATAAAHALGGAYGSATPAQQDAAADWLYAHSDPASQWPICHKHLARYR